MDAEQAIYEGVSKFMCDGETYASRKDAEDKAKEYEEKDFEVRIVEKGGSCYIYTRRVVTEIVLESEAPA